MCGTAPALDPHYPVSEPFSGLTAPPKYPEIGLGIIGRVVRDVQRRHLAPRIVGSKWGTDAAA
jgi:hypothetical protein